MRFGRRTRLLCTLLLAAAWMASVSWTESAFAQFILCQPAQSPCCPQPGNNTSESCPACQLAANSAFRQTRDPEDGQSQRQRDFLPAHVSRKPNRRSPRGPRRKLVQGLRYQPGVFDLKDDLRI